MGIVYRALECRAIVSLDIEFQVIESLAIESLAIESLAIESLAIESLAIESRALQLPITILPPPPFHTHGRA